VIVGNQGEVAHTELGDSCGVFSGVSTLNLDAKGRLAVPARHRGALSDSNASHVVVTINPSEHERCLLLYPENEWHEVARNLSRRETMNSAVRAMQRLVLGHAVDLELDGQGRILLPGELREFAQLDKRVSLVGQVNKIEIWDEVLWKGNRDQWLSEVSSADSAVDLQGLMF